jgi:hypothetical protein
VESAGPDFVFASSFFVPFAAGPALTYRGAALRPWASEDAREDARTGRCNATFSLDEADLDARYVLGFLIF